MKRFLPAAAFLLLALLVIFLGTRPGKASVTLPVPYVSQVPQGVWVLPWDQACEEASVSMVEGYYRHETAVSNRDAIARMQAMFPWEDAAFGRNDDTDAKQTVELIRHRSSFAASVIRRPTEAQIRDQIRGNHPVIAMVNDYALYGERPMGDSYHVIVIVGFDETAGEFTVHDPARGPGVHYPTKTVMDALHDYDPKTREADAEPTVLFTARPFWLSPFSR